MFNVNCIILVYLLNNVPLYLLNIPQGMAEASYRAPMSILSGPDDYFIANQLEKHRVQNISGPDTVAINLSRTNGTVPLLAR